MIDHRDAGESRFYAYDELDRLWKSTDLSASPRFEYVYDAAGNRTSMTSAAGTTMTVYESDSDRIAQQTGASPRYYAHDAFGNRIYTGSAPYTGSKSHVFDESNRLVELRDPVTSTSLATYAYDAFGRRVTKNVSGQTTLFFYDTEGHTIEQLAVNPTGDDTAEDFVWVEDEPMGLVHWAKEVGSGAGGGSGPPAFYWIHGDHLRTPLAMTDTPATPATAKTVWRASHEPFGLATVQTDPDGDSVHIALDLRFPGQVYDAESGLHQNLFRTYDPDVASYLESDPIGYSTHAHAYNYADNQPMKWIDPTGLIRLPGDPSGLPDEWTRDPTHRDPNGERWRHPSGDFLDFHRGRPGMPGNRGKDHWHHKDDAEHLPPGSDVPDSSESPDGSSSPCGGECQKKLVMVVGASGSIYLTYRCIRLVPSMFPPLWWTIPSNLVVP